MVLHMNNYSWENTFAEEENCRVQLGGQSENTTAQQVASDVHTAFMGMVEKCCPLKKRMAWKTEIEVKNSAALVKIKQQLDILATAVSVTEEERLYDAYKRI
ncbi:hypothetical protein HHI36_012218 [Cryptolaemus montrouzieri]|uniref:Uncharacterized protein n=1 Tax=Cryptolaemus montrouzieri TaxID=559131 RepID=A0ABD2NDM1_9CUCU